MGWQSRRKMFSTFPCLSDYLVCIRISPIIFYLLVSCIWSKVRWDIKTTHKQQQILYYRSKIKWRNYRLVVWKKLTFNFENEQILVSNFKIKIAPFCSNIVIVKVIDSVIEAWISVVLTGDQNFRSKILVTLTRLGKLSLPMTFKKIDVVRTSEGTSEVKYKSVLT